MEVRLQTPEKNWSHYGRLWYTASTFFLGFSDIMRSTGTYIAPCLIELSKTSPVQYPLHPTLFNSYLVCEINISIPSIANIVLPFLTTF